MPNEIDPSTSKKSWVKAVGTIKMERGCEDARCAGYPKGVPSVLSWDDRPGVTKSFELSQAAQGHSRTGRFVKGSRGNLVPEGITWQDMLNEMAKCDVVCKNCHEVRNVDRRVQPDITAD